MQRISKHLRESFKIFDCAQYFPKNQTPDATSGLITRRLFSWSPRPFASILPTTKKKAPSSW